MHSAMMVAVLALALYWRWQHTGTTGAWQERWQKALLAFLLPPLLVVMTAVAVAWMGPRGEMIGWQAGWLGYGMAIAFLSFSVYRCGELVRTGWRSLCKVSDCVQVELAGQSVRLLEVPTLFAAQIGFWRSQVVVSRGLVEQLDQPHLEAVLHHESAHSHFHDTFWFFWLGCIRQVTVWLPKTQVLWEELLLLRELRADRWAAQQTDGLLVAESLLWLASGKVDAPEPMSAAFGVGMTGDRLEERIASLLDQPTPLEQTSHSFLLWLVLAFLPFMSLPLHS